jgi:FkbM family methyltransferase
MKKILFKIKRGLQRLFLRLGLWVSPLTRFQRDVISISYKNGYFSFLQIGANDGVSFDDFFWLVTHFNGRGLALEPLSDPFERLSHNYRPYQRVKPLKLAVHPEKTEIQIYKVAHQHIDRVPAWAFGSASMSETWLPNQGVSSDLIESEVCQASHLMKIIADNNIHSLDVLQIDVEGFDLDVVEMINFSVLKPSIIRFEHPQQHSESDGRQYSKIMSLLRMNGYEVYTEGMDSVALLR